MNPKAICISHSGYAGGETVGRLVSERLGFRYVDEEVIREAADRAELDPAFVGDVERRKPLVARLLGNLSTQQSSPRLGGGDATRTLPSESDLQLLISDTLHSLAQEGSVVIVAHAASFVVSGSDFLRVFVTASPETRARRVIAAGDADKRTAAKKVKDDDLARAGYLSRFYGIERELPTHFDLVLNTDFVTPEKGASIVVSAAKSSDA